MKISVLVPVYNVKDYLEQCIRSVLAQSYTDYELILVDDGSTDQSGAICDEYAAKDRRIRVIHKENCGQLHTRLTALQHASGTYCVYLDADDYLDTNALERIERLFDEQACDCVIFGYRRMQDDRCLSVCTEQEDRLVTDQRELFKKCLFQPVYNSMCRKAFRRDLGNVKDYSQYYHLRLGEDLLQSIEILNKCKRVFFSTEILYNYRMTPGSVTNGQMVNMQLGFMAREWILTFVLENGVFTDQDIREYRVNQITTILWGKITAVSEMKTPYRNKVTMYDEIRASNYWKSFLSQCQSPQGMSRSIYLCYRLFGHRKDALLLSVLSIRECGKRLLGKR